MVAAFVLGVGAGVWFTEDVNLYPNNVASTELIDRRTPNSEVCMTNGYSAMVFDQRIFVSFNPYDPCSDCVPNNACEPASAHTESAVLVSP